MSRLSLSSGSSSLLSFRPFVPKAGINVGTGASNVGSSIDSADLTVKLSPGLLGWNLGLALTSVILALTFVSLANYLVSEKYSLEVLRQRLSKTNVELELEGAAVENQFSIGSFLLSAKNLGLVEEKEIDFIGLNDFQKYGYPR